MFKQTILSVLFITILACSVSAALAPSFSFTKLFERDVNKRAFMSTICCLPNTFSMKGTYNRITVAKNNTLQLLEGSLIISSDFNSGKFRQDTSTTHDGKLLSSSVETVVYSIENEMCECFKNKHMIPFCISNEGTITKAKIGEYETAKITNNQYGDYVTTWLFKEPQMSSDRCWILSRNELDSNIVVQEQSYYDMVEKVDPNVFNIPNQCPSINTCLSQ